MSRQAAEERYRERRHRAFRETELVATAGGVGPTANLMMREISPLALTATMTAWNSDPRRRTRWNWTDLRDRYQRNYPSRFDLEILSGGETCAFSLGKPSKTNAHCSLDYVEASPNPAHPLKGKILVVVFTALELYCDAIGAREMRVLDPAPALIPLYVRKYGFAVAHDAGGIPYCRREVKL